MVGAKTHNSCTVRTARNGEPLSSRWTCRRNWVPPILRNILTKSDPIAYTRHLANLDPDVRFTWQTWASDDQPGSRVLEIGILLGSTATGTVLSYEDETIWFRMRSYVGSDLNQLPGGEDGEFVIFGPSALAETPGVWPKWSHIQKSWV